MPAWTLIQSRTVFAPNGKNIIEHPLVGAVGETGIIGFGGGGKKEVNLMRRFRRREVVQRAGRAVELSTGDRRGTGSGRTTSFVSLEMMGANDFLAGNQLYEL